MKLKNIVAMISFLMVAVSCSMEDDVLNEVTKSDSSNNSNQTEVYLSFNINVNSVSTKASFTDPTIGTETDASEVKDCSVILFDGNKIVGAYKEKAVGSDNKLVGAKFLVKSGMKYTVYVIANTNKDFTGCADKAAVEALAFDGDDLNGLVKFGKESFTAEAGTSSVYDENIPVQTVSVSLNNLAAQVRLMDVRYAGFKNNTNPTTVTLTKVEFINQNLGYSIDGTTVFELNDENVVVSPDAEKGKVEPVLDGGKKYDDDMICDFLTFPNVSSSTPVALKLTFQVGSKTETRTYIVNRPTGVEGMTNNAVDGNQGVNNYVHAGFIYQLYATVAVEGDTFDCTIKCCTKDWLYNEYEVTMTEI